MVIEDGLVLGEFVIEALGGLVGEEEIFVDEGHCI